MRRKEFPVYMGHKRLTCLMALLFVMLCLFGCSGNAENITTESVNEIISEAASEETTMMEAESILPETENSTIYDTEEETTISPEPVSQELTVHFIDVGQGDCTLIICGDDAMLIDAGDNNQGTRIQNYIQHEGISKLKYVVCTHPDADHIGGMDVILYKFDCETIFMTDEEKDTITYRDVIDTIENKIYKKTLPVVGEQYRLGDAEFTILAPSQMREDSNNNSIVLMLSHGNNTFLFTGDAEEDEESDIVKLDLPAGIDVYKTGHHGSKSSSSEELLNAITPKYAVISCGEGNKYGHPHAQTLNNFRMMGIQVFRTDEQGTIIASSNGEEITWNCSPSTSWIAGEPIGTQEESSKPEPESEAAQQTETQAAIDVPPVVAEETNPPAPVTYICNTNTKKFHYPTCSSVDQMKETNKLEVNLSRDEVIAQGYVPCKRCNP